MSKEKNEIDKNMILVEAGRFEVGTKPNTKLVTIGNDFYICKYPVTFEEYDEFCEKEGRNKPGDRRWGRGTRPVINITWYDAIEYCNWKSKKDGYEEVYKIDSKGRDILDNTSAFGNLICTVNCNFDKNGYRLPTEAERLFAARGGNESKNYIYSGSNEINEVAWYKDNSEDKTQPVGQQKSNELGIYDMSGNVEEWCWDWDSYFGFTKPVNNNYDPIGTKTGSHHVVRGGNWRLKACNCEVSNRYTNARSFYYDIGFRVSRTRYFFSNCYFLFLVIFA